MRDVTVVDEACGCRCHAGDPPDPAGHKGCAECDSEAYESCDRCGMPVYAHYFDERPRHPGACEQVFSAARDAALREAELEAAGQQRLFGGVE